MKLIKVISFFGEDTPKAMIVYINDIYYYIYCTTYQYLLEYKLIQIKERTNQDQSFSYDLNGMKFLYNCKFFFDNFNEKDKRYDPIEEVAYTNSSSEHCIGDELALMEFLSKIGGE